MSPAGRSRATVPSVCLKLVLTLYVLAAALLPLAHHDIVCHLKSSTHCTTCVVGSSAEAGTDPASFAPFGLVDAGAAACLPPQHARAVAWSVGSGRAPPVAA